MKASHQRRFVFVTGSDTGVGKTVLTAALTRHLRAASVNAVALKPLCSGGREDARALRAAADNVIALDEVNPWHFRAALAPTLAARRERRRVTLTEVAARVRASARLFELALVEGAGGLLSPLAEDGDNRDLIAALRPDAVIIVVPDRLGAVNQARLVLGALPSTTHRRYVVVLVEQEKPDAASRTNAAFLAEFRPEIRIVRLPRRGRSGNAARTVEALEELAACLRA